MNWSIAASGALESNACQAAIRTVERGSYLARYCTQILSADVLCTLDAAASAIGGDTTVPSMTAVERQTALINARLRIRFLPLTAGLIAGAVKRNVKIFTGPRQGRERSLARTIGHR